MNWISFYFNSIGLRSSRRLYCGRARKREELDSFIRFPRTFDRHLITRMLFSATDVTVNINRCTCGACRRHFRLGVFRTGEVLTGAHRCFRSRRCITRTITVPFCFIGRLWFVYYRVTSRFLSIID